jgi:hypothetical protein
MRGNALARAALLGLGLVAAAAAQREAPELDFLEYLGSWQGEDDEWLVIEQWAQDAAEDADVDAGEATTAPPPEQKRDADERE